MNIEQGTPHPKAKVSSGLLLQLLILFAFVIAGLFVGQFLGVLFAIPFIGFDIDAIIGLASNPPATDKARNALLAMQLGSSLGLFVLASVTYMKWYERIEIGKLFSYRAPQTEVEKLKLVVLSVVGLLVFLPFVAWSTQFNQSLHLPDNWSAIESWMRSTEENLSGMVEFMTAFSSTGQFLFGALVIAVLPGIGEELLFRGILQRKLTNHWRNGHLAIWVSAVLFSAMHMQFLGFLPRMFLGAIMGYLFWFTGSLWLPIIAHFVNNLLTISLLYMHRLGIIDMNVEDPQNVPFVLAFTSLLFTAVVLLAVKKQGKSVLGVEPEEEKNWKKVYSSTNQLHATIVTDTLRERNIGAFTIDKVDSAYNNFGEYEVLVAEEHVVRAVKIIADDIKFE